MNFTLTRVEKVKSCSFVPVVRIAKLLSKLSLAQFA
jgi:hypothetical protein